MMNQMKDGVAASPGFKAESYAGCDVCAEASPNNEIRISGKGSRENPAIEFQHEAQGGI